MKLPHAPLLVLLLFLVPCIEAGNQLATNGYPNGDLHNTGTSAGGILGRSDIAEVGFLYDENDPSQVPGCGLPQCMDSYTYCEPCDIYVAPGARFALTHGLESDGDPNTFTTFVTGQQGPFTTEGDEQTCGITNSRFSQYETASYFTFTNLSGVYNQTPGYSFSQMNITLRASANTTSPETVCVAFWDRGCETETTPRCRVWMISGLTTTFQTYSFNFTLHSPANDLPGYPPYAVDLAFQRLSGTYPMSSRIDIAEITTNDAAPPSGGGGSSGNDGVNAIMAGGVLLFAFAGVMAATFGLAKRR